jgi:carboxypeptidase family protein
MVNKSLWIGLVGLILCTSSALAAGSVLQGVVKDAEGNPIKAAAIRIETTNGGKLMEIVRTSANGHYTSDALAAGTYRITLVVNGVVRSSINNTRIHLDRPTELNFDLTSASAASRGKKGTHLVWVPPFTGSRLPGRWVEVDDNRSWAGAHVSSENVVQISGEELQRTIHSVTIKRGQ